MGLYERFADWRDRGDCVQGRPLGERLQGLAKWHKRRVYRDEAGVLLTCSGCGAQVFSPDANPVAECPACQTELDAVREAA